MSLLAVRGLVKHYRSQSSPWGSRAADLRALDGVTFDLEAGQTLGIVGESGSGKTTLARCVLRLIEPTAGEVWLDGEDLLRLPARELRLRRRALQMVFQDPYGSLDPRQRVDSILEEPLRVHRIGDRPARRRRVAELLELVGLPQTAAVRYPHEFSGGQRQRIGIARALAPGPRVIVADEPVSALDVSIRAQILNLLAGVQRELGLAVLFIGHDLAVVEQVADRIAVMYLGRFVEQGPCAAVLRSPRHPYTQALLRSVPTLQPGKRHATAGEPPDPAHPPAGCAYHPRCPKAQEVCRTHAPALAPDLPDRQVACHFADQA